MVAISLETVRNRVSNSFTNLQVPDRFSAVVKALGETESESAHLTCLSSNYSVAAPDGNTVVSRS
jgi:hypothetical protein